MYINEEKWTKNNMKTKSGIKMFNTLTITQSTNYYMYLTTTNY
jgi:hypothetical protein